MIKPPVSLQYDLNLALLEAEAYADEIYQEFMNELYGKLPRPDRSMTYVNNSLPPMPLPGNPIPESGGQPSTPYAG
jgi:hypothetical protein